jgi:hypothetical protein
MYNTYQYVVIPSVDNALSYLYVHVFIVYTYLDVFFFVFESMITNPVVPF